MTKVLSIDLRERVVVVIHGGAVAVTGGSAVRGQRVERDPLARSGIAVGQRDAEPAGRRSAIESDRGAR